MVLVEHTEKCAHCKDILKDFDTNLDKDHYQILKESFQIYILIYMTF